MVIGILNCYQPKPIVPDRYTKNITLMYFFLFLRSISALTTILCGLIIAIIAITPDLIFALISHRSSVLVVLGLITFLMLSQCLIVFLIYQYRITNHEGFLTVINGCLLTKDKMFLNYPLYYNKIKQIPIYQEIKVSLPANDMNEHLPFQKMTLSLVVKLQSADNYQNVVPVNNDFLPNLLVRIENEILATIKSQFGHKFGPKNLAQLCPGSLTVTTGLVIYSWPHKYLRLDCQSTFDNS